MSPLIPRNTRIPTKKSQIYTTAEDYQTTLDIKVYEGERSMTNDNHLLGRFDLTGIPPALRHVPQVDVTFEIDIDGMLKVSATDTKTGNMNHIVIENDDNRLSSQDIERMIADREKYSADDKKMKDRVQSKNNLEVYIYDLKNTMENQKMNDKLNSDEKKLLTQTVEKEIEWLEINQDADGDEFKNRRESLRELLKTIIGKFYDGGSSRPPRDEL